MNIFVINSGSSSIKYQLIEMPFGKVVCNGIVERIGKEDAAITHKIFRGEKELSLPTSKPMDLLIAEKIINERD